MKDYLQYIAEEVKDIFDHDITTAKTFFVPGREDSGLTFGFNQIKKGKTLETCVLFIDIRNSTQMSRNLSRDKAKLGKIYAAFIYAMVKIADKYGYVRNIIGDRVMVVFEPGQCFEDSVNCAVTMYTVATKIIKHYSGLEKFSVGIGIDYGEMLILKTGIQKRHEEKSEYKSLVWVGDAANRGSKLTDFANKSYNSPTFRVSYEYMTWVQQQPSLLQSQVFPSKTSGLRFSGFVANQTSVILSSLEFLEQITFEDGMPKYNNNKVLKIEREEQKGTTSPILISGRVYRGFCATVPGSPFVRKFFKRDYPESPLSTIYGGLIYWPEIQQVKL